MRLTEEEIAERFNVKVGDGVTVCWYTDSNSYTVIKRTPKTITIQRDKAVLKPTFKPEFSEGGFIANCTNNEKQEWVIEPDPNGHTMIAHWSNVNQCWQIDKYTPIVNGRFEYYDYNF